MAMRLSGMYSGMDTESIVQDLVAVKRVKIDDMKKKQQKLEWKQDAWKELNGKIKKFYNGALDAMRFQGNYSKKETKVSDDSVADVIAQDGAMNSVQKLKVTQLAQSAYLTGGVIQKADGEECTSGTKLTELGIDIGSDISITTKGKTTKITVTEDMTIGRLTDELRKAGVNANFDSKTQRFFIGAKESGADFDFSFEGSTLDQLGLTETSGANKLAGQDAKIELNGAEFTSSSNTFEINGLTINCKSETGVGAVTLTTRDDHSGIYDLIKNFIKEYNGLVNEMDKLFNAPSAKGYEPLTEEEKYEMSEKEIEKWEEKIKASLFRRDDTLNSVSSAFHEVMASGVSVAGKTMYLTDFGIGTLNYFEAPDNERNVYHIQGDKDDSLMSGKEDKLSAMISSDPDAVVEFFSGLAKKLYDKSTDLMKNVPNYSSAYTVYEDKKMKSDYDQYTKQIKELEERLKKYEDRWYAKFSEMETAMAKMQSNASAITGLIGG